MDASIVSAVSALLGSVVGGTASIATAWFTQRSQGRREATRAETQRRELVYTEFIAECSKLIIDALDNTLDRPATLVAAYAIQNRIRLTSSEQVVRAAEDALRKIVAQYFQPNVTMEQLKELVNQDGSADPLRPFSEACREEIRRLQHVA
jgi:hypothetical protein